MQKILIGTNNEGKIREYKILFENIFDPVPLNYLGIDFDVDEEGLSYQENAIIKLKYLKNKSPFPVITDDSGLEVISLNNEPGIFSARYSGKNPSDKKNINKLLKMIKNTTDRTARFVCSIAYFNNEYSTEIITSYGECYGSIIDKQKGHNGFGYDPIFYVKELSKTFAELKIDQKSLISHRAKAVKNLLKQLNI